MAHSETARTVAARARMGRKAALRRADPKRCASAWKEAALASVLVFAGSGAAEAVARA